MIQTVAAKEAGSLINILPGRFMGPDSVPLSQRPELASSAARRAGRYLTSLRVFAAFAGVGVGHATHPADVRGRHVQASGSAAALDSTTKLQAVNAQVRWLDYRGRRALNLAPLPGHEHAVNEEMTAILTQSDFKDGTIEVNVAGARRAGYSKAEDVTGFKGMIGLSFRMQGDRAERLYVRPQNARLDNQLFRNRATQYESVPGFPSG